MYGVSTLVSLADYKGVRKNDLFSKKIKIELIKS